MLLATTWAAALQLTTTMNVFPAMVLALCGTIPPITSHTSHTSQPSASSCATSSLAKRKPQTLGGTPKTSEKWLSWRFQKICASQWENLCKFFGRQKFRKYFRKHHVERDKESKFHQPINFFDDPQDHGMKFGKKPVNSVNMVN